MLDQTLATYIKHIEKHCDNPGEIADYVADLYERLLNLERTKRESTKLLSYKRKADTFMTEVLELARTKIEFRIGRNRKNFDEAYWVGFYGSIMRDLPDKKFSTRDQTQIDNIEQNLKGAPLRSKCILYWIVNTFDTDWMPLFKQWTREEKLFVCDVPHDLILRDLRIQEHTWLSFWFNVSFNSEFFERYILQEIEKGKSIAKETREQIDYIKQLRP